MTEVEPPPVSGGGGNGGTGGSWANFGMWAVMLLGVGLFAIITKR